MPKHIGVDLGRQHSHCSLRDHAGRRLVPFDRGETGLWLRWSGPDRSERITDRVLRLAGDDQEHAIETVERVVAALFPELAAGDRLGTSPVVVVPAAFGPDCRRAVIEGFARAGVTVPNRHLVERPVAGLALWLTAATERPTGVACVIDNDHGQISIAAADLDARRLLICRPLSVRGDDDPGRVRARLADAMARLGHLLGDPTGDAEPRVERETDRHPPIHVDHLVLSGTALDHPRLTTLVAGTFGSLVPRILGDQTAPVLGAVCLDALDGFSAGWPTLTLTIDDRPLGTVEVRSPEGAHGIDLAPGPGATRTARVTSRLGLVDAGDAVAVRSGSVDASGIDLPADLGELRVRVFDDGRVLVLGDHGTRALGMRVLWPAPGKRVEHVTVHAIGRRPLVLDQSLGRRLSATTDRPHPATVS